MLKRQHPPRLPRSNVIAFRFRQITPTAHFANDLGLDSLDTVEVVMAIEEVRLSPILPNPTATLDFVHAQTTRVHSYTDALCHRSSASRSRTRTPMRSTASRRPSSTSSSNPMRTKTCPNPRLYHIMTIQIPQHIPPRHPAVLLDGGSLLVRDGGASH
ncbi:hypothetical protein VTJ49DRAFT_5166 [Mycothermus thermophilus]|uniref:Carrier domain-containing protein n=1 Tax=Humicola insolens TaxID=85995 RepID=A0ABR3V4T1_HUMIN